MNFENVTSEVQRYCKLIKSHKQTISIDNVNKIKDFHSIAFEITVEVRLTLEWSARGESPNGVRLKENVRIDYNRNFPWNTPEISLRYDFNNNLPHIQPWRTHDKRVVPCLYFGNLSDYYSQHGILGLLDLLSIWLEKAAQNSLIDPNQGWEPSRRDGYNKIVIADPLLIRNCVNRGGGYRFFRYEEIKATDTDFKTGKFVDEAIPINKVDLSEIFRIEQYIYNTYIVKGLAAVVWPQNNASSISTICDKYSPDYVSTIRDLKLKSKEYHCYSPLKTSTPIFFIINCAPTKVV